MRVRLTYLVVVVPVHRGPNTVVKVGRGKPMQVKRGGGGIKLHLVYVVATSRHFLRRVFRPDGCLHRVVQFTDRAMVAAAQVVLAVDVGVVDRPHDPVHQIVHVNHVAGGVDNGAGLPHGKTLVEGGDGAAEVAWPVDVRQPENHMRNVAQGDVLLPRDLADRVRRDRR